MSEVEVELDERSLTLRPVEDVLAVRLVETGRRRRPEVAVEELDLGEPAEELLGERSENVQAFLDGGWVFVDPSERVEKAERARSAPEGTSHVGRVFRDDSDRVLVETGRLTVEFDPALSEDEAERRLADADLDVVRQLTFGTNLYQVRVAPGEDPLEVTRELVDDPDVVFAEPEFVEHVDQREVVERRERYAPSDPDYDRQWQWHNDGTGGATEGADVDAEAAWSLTTGAGIRLAVVDNGFDVAHPDLADGIGEGAAYYRDDGSGDGEFVVGLEGYPDNSHGTFCAGMAAARADNGEGGCGAAFDAELLPVASLVDQLTTQTTLARAIGYAADPTREPEAADAGLSAADGADVVSCSLGPSSGADWPMFRVLRRAVDFAVDRGRGGRGTPVFWAASNGSVPIDGPDGTDEVVGYENTIAIASTDDTDSYGGAAFGPDLDAVAPGIDVYSTTSRGGYVFDTGTSYATPCAAGVAALVLSVAPGLSAGQVHDLLGETADEVGDVTYEDGRHDRFGAGRVNAAAAVAAAAEREPAAGPSIEGPERASFPGPPPTFAVDRDGDQFFAVEVATRRELFDYERHGHEREPGSFYPVWPPEGDETPAPETGDSYELPESVWRRLLDDGGDRLYYRMYTTDSSDWDTWRLTVPDREADSAPAVEIDRGGTGERAFSLSGSVGRNGVNRTEDVRALQRHLVDLGYDWLAVDGIVGENTVWAIRLFQSIKDGRQQVGGDGRVDVPGPTYEWLLSSHAPRWQRMPEGDPEGSAGFYNVEVAEQDWDDHDHGTDWLADTVRAAGRAYRDDHLATHPDAAPLTVNDVSKPRGGPTHDHEGHQTGLACDLRLPRTDGTAPGNTTVDHDGYDRAAMRAMLGALHAEDPRLFVILDDEDLAGDGLCIRDPDHDDHAHVEISPPEGAP